MSAQHTPELSQADARILRAVQERDAALEHNAELLSALQKASEYLRMASPKNAQLVVDAAIAKAAGSAA